MVDVVDTSILEEYWNGLYTKDQVLRIVCDVAPAGFTMPLMNKPVWIKRPTGQPTTKIEKTRLKDTRQRCLFRLSLWRIPLQAGSAAA